MDKSDWLLLAIGDRMQPIQLQKTLFKFAKESNIPPEEAYEFVPYNWGPCSFGIYDDVAALREEGLVEAIPSGRGWSVYVLTDKGKARAKEVAKGAAPALVESLNKKREWVTSRDFETLLKDMYQQYPEFATESLFMKQ